MNISTSSRKVWRYVCILTCPTQSTGRASYMLKGGRASIFSVDLFRGETAAGQDTFFVRAHECCAPRENVQRFNPMVSLQPILT